MKNEIPCINCIVLPICRGYVKRYGEEMITKRSMVILLRNRCSKLLPYIIDGSRGSFTYNPKRIDNIVYFMDNPL